MNTQELINRKECFNANGGYKQDAMPEVYTHYQEYLKTGKYPYLSSVVEFIKSKEVIPSEIEGYLKTEVYLSANQHRAQVAYAYQKDMINNGWNILTPEVIKRECETHNKIEVSAVTQGAIFSGKLEGIFKPFIDDNGNCYIMKPRATRKGYPLQNLQNPFYKVVTK